MNLARDVKRSIDDALSAAGEGQLELALSRLIKASESCVEGLSLTQEKAERRALLALFDESTEHAGNIKARQRAAGEQSTIKVATHAPLETRQISKKEQILLLKSSSIDGKSFPIWNDEHIQDHLLLHEPFTDAVQVFRTDADYIHGFRRAREVITGEMQSDPSVEFFDTLSQIVLNDCSLVASLIVASQWSTRFSRQLVSNNLFPQNELGEPIFSVFGKHMVRVWLNGSFRQIIIDDFIPQDLSGSVHRISTFSTNHPRVVWPALIEKAYLKMASCHFAGSNSAYDLRLLTGWIPEQIAFHEISDDLYRYWQELILAWNSGHVLITLGTGKLSAAEESDCGLVSEHSYAITGIHDKGDSFSLRLQNPWAGPSTEIGVDMSLKNYKTIFELDLNTVALQFSTIFLSWNPSVWKHQVSLHSQITEDNFSWTEHNLISCPQFSLENCTDRTLSTCVVLSRHRSSQLHSNVYSSLALFDTAARVIVNKQAICKTDWYGSPDVTLKVSIPKSSTHVLVLLQRNALPSETISLVCHHDAPPDALRLQQVPVSDCVKVICDSWTRSTSGGNPSLPTFARNPQFNMTLQQSSKVMIFLETKSDYDVNIDVTQTHHRPVRVDRAIIRGKEYCHGCQLVSTTLKPGSYALIPSTYDANQQGEFKLTFLSIDGRSDGMSIEQAPELGGGQFRTIVASHYSDSKPIQRFEIGSNYLNHLTFHVHPQRQSTHHRISLKNPQGVVVMSEEGKGSLALDRVKVYSRVAYSLICQTLERSGLEGGFEIQIYSDSAISVKRC